MVDVIATDEFADWIAGLWATDKGDAEAVEDMIGVLESQGLALGFPQSSKIKGASFALRELRVQSGGKPLRVFYTFDPRREAVLLLGGDKTGNEKFYEQMVPRVTQIWTRYLAEQAAGDHDDE